MAELPPDPQPYGAAAYPVRQDMFEYIVEVGWPGGWALVEMPTTHPGFGPLGCYMVPLDATGDPLFPGPEIRHFAPNGKGYLRGLLIPKNDYADPVISTTAILPGGTALTNLGSVGIGGPVVESLHADTNYFISGPGIPSKAFFTFDASTNGGTLSAPITTVATPLVPVPVKISNWVFQPFNEVVDWLSPPVLFDYSSLWGPGSIYPSGYWGELVPDGFPLDRFDTLANIDDITDGPPFPAEDYLGPGLVTFFSTVRSFGDPDWIDFFFNNWISFDDTLEGPRFHDSPKVGPARIFWNRDWYILTFFRGAGRDTDSYPPGYKGWPMDSGGVPFTIAGPRPGDPNYPVPGVGDRYGAKFWLIKEPTAAWSYQYLVDFRKVREVKIMQRATTTPNRASLGTAIDLEERFPGYPRTHGVTVRMFSGSTRFFIDMTGRLIPVRVDATDLMTPANARWSHIFAPLATKLGADSELGRFDKNGPTPSPLPPGFP